MRTTLIPLRKHIRQTIQEKREMLIYNISALKFIKDTHMPSTGNVDEGAEESGLDIGSSKALKRKRVKI